MNLKNIIINILKNLKYILTKLQFWLTTQLDLFIMPGKKW